MRRPTEQQPRSGGSGHSPRTSGSRRRARDFRVRCLMLLSMCLSTFSSGPAALAADPRPFVPPLACCDDYKCPCHTNTCVGLPCIPVCDPAVEGAGAGPAWHLTLQEAVNTAMSNSEAVRNLGLVESASRNDIVRSVITTYDAPAAFAEAAGEWGIFDPLFTVEMLWDKQDIPPGTSFSGIGNRPPQLDTADFEASIEQLLPIGTRLRAALVTDYLFNPANPPALNPNPQYFSFNQYGISQPLLRGFGVDVTTAPIKIACAQAERTDWQFKQEMLAMVRSIETTYWALYAQQQNLKSIEAVLPSFREVVRLRQEQATGAVGSESEVARAQSDLYLFEQRRLETMSLIAEQQLVLRNLMGLPPNDCRDIVLLAIPTTTRPTETLQCAVQRAINSRPDVLRQRLAVYIASQERLLAENGLMPQLDLNGFFQTNGLGEDLDQSFESKDTNDFESWQMGVFFQIPLGRRLGRAQLQAAQLRMSRERALLQQTAHQASYEVVDAYRRLNWVYQQLEIVAQRERAISQSSQGARATFENPPSGITTVFALELYLGNLRDASDAAISKNALLAEYNSALARLAEVTGSLLENRMIQIAGDASDTLPAQLPPAEIQLPEAVLPSTPAQPAPAQPAPPQPQPAQPQPLPQGDPPQAVAPQTLPEIQMPESLQPQDAYADLPITPTPEPMVAPIVEAPPSQSALPDPAYTAMRPQPIETPEAESPLISEPMAADPIPPTLIVDSPLAEAPTIQQPAAVGPQRQAVRPAPSERSPTQDGPTLMMPQSIAPAPEVAQAPPSATPRAAEVRTIQQPSLQMPSSVSAAPLQPQYSRQATAPAMKPARHQAEPKLVMPSSVRPAAAVSPIAPRAETVYRAPAKQPAALKGAALQFPSSVGPVMR